MSQEQKRDELLARYANCFNVGHNAFEFVVDFGQFQEGAEPGIHTRIITGPAFAKVLSNLLGESIDRYEEEFGSIPNAADEG